MDVRTAFSTLGLDPSASVETIRDAYRDLVKIWHPDRFPGDPRVQARADDMMRAINAAYDVALAFATAPPAAAAGAAGSASYAAAASASGFASSGRSKSRPRIEPSLFFFRATLIGGLGLLLLAAMAPRSPVRAGTPPAGFNRLGTIAGSYAATPEQLASVLEGTWLLEGWLFEFRQGAIYVRGESQPVAFYDPDTNASLIYREGATGDRVSFDIEFTPTTMQWFTGKGTDRHLVHEFRRCCAL